MKKSTGDSYLTALNCLLRYIAPRDSLDISEITADFLRGYEKFIENEPGRQGGNRKTEKKDIKPKSGRAVSAYPACIRAVHNLAKKEFNKEDRGIIHIPYSPFKNYKIKPQPKTRKRGLTPETLQAVIDLPYEKEGASRLNLAKDCFILSFALIGMNGADMYYAGPVKRKTLIYNRRKTADRRDDNAEMRVRIDGCLSRLMEKYADPRGKRLFNFYTRYATPFTFNKALNTGLKRIGGILGIEGLEFYAARHSWATIARSSDVGIDKATVHEALNHVDNAMKVTDIYIDRDWTVIWNANKKVLALFDWTAVGYDVL
jgi:integrase